MVEIYYRDISLLDIKQIKYQVFLQIQLPTVKLSIPRAMLISDAYSDELCKFLVKNGHIARSFIPDKILKNGVICEAYRAI